MVELNQCSDDFIDLNPELKSMLGNTGKSKYGNRRRTHEGITFDSGHEASEGAKAIAAEKAHKIFNLGFHVRFPLYGGTYYECDWCFFDENLQPVIVDAKGHKTAMYKLKKKQFEAKYKIKITEV